MIYVTSFVFETFSKRFLSAFSNSSCLKSIFEKAAFSVRIAVEGRPNHREKETRLEASKIGSLSLKPLWFSAVTYQGRPANTLLT